MAVASSECVSLQILGVKKHHKLSDSHEKEKKSDLIVQELQK